MQYIVKYATRYSLKFTKKKVRKFDCHYVKVNGNMSYYNKSV